MEALVLKSSYRNLTYWNIDIENIEPANRIKQGSQIPYRTSTTDSLTKARDNVQKFIIHWLS